MTLEEKAIEFIRETKGKSKEDSPDKQIKIFYEEEQKLLIWFATKVTKKLEQKLEQKELLGIIQEKDKAIKKLIADMAGLEEENEQLRNNGFTVSAMTEQQLKVAIEKGEQLEKENAELKEKLNIRSCKNCKHNNKSCPNDGSCKHYSKWEDFENPQLTKAKKIIKKQNKIIEDVCDVSMLGSYAKETIKQAEQFINNNKIVCEKNTGKFFGTVS